MELLVCSEVIESTNNVSSLHFVDLSTGQTLFSFKSSPLSINTLTFIRSKYILHAVPKKALLHVFEVTRTGHQPKKIVTPGVVNVLCASADGALLAAGIGEKIILWDLESGDLLGILVKHYQDITCLKFTDDCGFLASAGADGLVLAWDVGELIQANGQTSDKETISSFVAHTLQVTGMTCSASSQNNPRIYTSSSDRTVKIHDPLIGKTLLSVVFDTAIISLTVDNAETVLCAGGMNGSIYRLDLVSVCQMKKNEPELHVASEDLLECSAVFKGHVSPVLVLSFSLDCSLLVSSAKNEGLCIWDVHSGQCVKTIKSFTTNSGTVTNLSVIPMPACLIVSGGKPCLNFPKLAHSTRSSGKSGDKPKLNIHHSRLGELPASCLDKFWTCAHIDSNASLKQADNMADEIEELQRKNKILHDFAVRKILAQEK